MNNKLKTSQQGLELIKHFEGFRSKAYLCPANVWTIGYGTTSGVKRGQVVTEAQATQMLQRDVEKFENAIKRHVQVPLRQNEFDALVSFVYNVGEGNFKSSTLLRLLNQGGYDDVYAQLQRWNRGGGRVLTGLVRRREAEGKLFDTGKVAL